MPRKPISITLDEGMIVRIDRLAEDEGMTRTAVIERALRVDLPDREWFNETLENPAVRELHRRLTSSPAVFRLIARAAAGDVSDEEIQAALDRAPRVRESARQRGAGKKVGKSKEREA